MRRAESDERILFVDDEPNVLAAYHRRLGRDFSLDTAGGGREALELMQGGVPYAVVVSDLRMPGMDGVDFLAGVKEAWPDTVRMMLTGHADVANAMKAVNRGNIFRLLAKPCDDVELIGALEAGIEQYRLVRAERELLEKTLSGAVSVLIQVLSTVQPKAFGRSSRIRRTVVETGKQLGYPRLWELEAAAMLCQVGYLILPESVLEKVSRGVRLDRAENELFDSHPDLAYELLANIPRLEGVADIVAYQEKHFDGSGLPGNSPRGEDIPLGARILKLALDLDKLQLWGDPPIICFEKLVQRRGWYDPDVLTALGEVIDRESNCAVVELEVDRLRPHMIVADDVRTVNGRKVVTRGTELTGPMVTHLKAFDRRQGLDGPVKVMEPKRL